MYTLPDRFEFQSDAWLAETRRFLEKAVEQRRDALAPFSLTERFVDAPPHLKLPDNVGAWHVRYDGGAVTVERGFDESADVRVQGDYQAGIAGGQFIGMLAPGAAKAMRRELATMHGKDAVKITGRLENPAAGEIISLLHDHLGRRTVENPDLCHRAQRQGLTGKIREMEEQGYTVIEHAISPEFADEVRAATIRALLPHQSFSMNWMLYHGREFEQLIQNPLLMTLIDASLGRGAVIASFSSIKKGPGPGVIPMHTDYAHVPEPFPEFSLTGVGVWALEDWTVAAGPTYIVPGSHKQRRNPRPGDLGHNEGVPIEMPKAARWSIFTTTASGHWQGERTEPWRPRHAARVTELQPRHPAQPRAEEDRRSSCCTATRRGSAEMLGEDDWFRQDERPGPRPHPLRAYV